MKHSINSFGVIFMDWSCWHMLMVLTTSAVFCMLRKMRDNEQLVTGVGSQLAGELAVLTSIALTVAFL
jgi:hypothetical protein